MKTTNPITSTLPCTDFPCASASRPLNNESFVFPACRFAEIARCKHCGYYSRSDRWCERHKTWTNPEKWGCSEFC